jgi:hypothetical protein
MIDPNKEIGNTGILPFVPRFFRENCRIEPYFSSG